MLTAALLAGKSLADLTFGGAFLWYLVKFIIYGAVAFGGILLGKHLRKKHDEKQQDEKQA